MIEKYYVILIDREKYSRPNPIAAYIKEEDAKVHMQLLNIVVEYDNDTDTYIHCVEVDNLSSRNEDTDTTNVIFEYDGSTLDIVGFVDNDEEAEKYKLLTYNLTEKLLGRFTVKVPKK